MEDNSWIEVQADAGTPSTVDPNPTVPDTTAPTATTVTSGNWFPEPGGANTFTGISASNYYYAAPAKQRTDCNFPLSVFSEMIPVLLLKEENKPLQ